MTASISADGTGLSSRYHSGVTSKPLCKYGCSLARIHTQCSILARISSFTLEMPLTTHLQNCRSFWFERPTPLAFSQILLLALHPIYHAGSFFSSNIRAAYCPRVLTRYSFFVPFNRSFAENARLNVTIRRAVLSRILSRKSSYRMKIHPNSTARLVTYSIFSYCIIFH